MEAENADRDGVWEHPVLSFDESLALAQKVKEIGPPVKLDVFAKAINQNVGGWFNMEVTSMRRWGLVEGRGELRLTPLFRRMTAPQKPGDDATARLEAFLQIRLFNELYNRYRDDGLPSDPYLPNTLRDTYRLSGRNPGLVARIVREFVTKYLLDFGKPRVDSAPMTSEPVRAPAQPEVELDQTSAGSFVLRVTSPDGELKWDIRHELDWTVVQAAVESIKERWKTRRRGSTSDSAETP